MADQPREGRRVSLGEALEGVMSSEAFTRYTGNERAAQAWFSANGDFEHRHTRGVFLKESGRRGVAPVLIVYVDNKSIEYDLRADKDIYLVRLAHYGFEVSDVEFKLSRTASGVRYEPPTPQRQAPPALVDLTPEEMEEIDEQVAVLEGEMRERVRSAMISSLRREKTLETQKTKTSPQNGS